MPPAIVLGIETSCDDACVALVADGTTVLGEAVASQADDFAAWGGVVPEIAARGHVLALPGLIERALATAGLAIDAIAAVAVVAAPGLIGSLLTGVTCAKAIAARRGLPLIAVDHIQAHLAAVHLGRDAVPYPLVGLVASGGHSHFYRCDGPGTAELLGGTIDDAAGEAFDKAASILGLGYPGGPAIDARARRGDPRRYALPRSFLAEDTPRLSFAGLKTALLYHVRGPLGRDPLTLDERGIDDACASFQAAVVDVLARKLVREARRHGVRAIAVGGGVACNAGLRARLTTDAAAAGLQLLMPEPRHCTDNAAMVAALGFHQWRRGDVAGLDVAPLPTGRAGPRAQ
ncbi:MAG TPA: tRNA (adenosine(37)-N6)-threonylcarbamoyltransferase complex transferase subunit TsaD [Planctomycetota bacterium]|nr:tRNA (adenosine(37)-N6)-threonylcarbamoyltransferase complex transferase subunit TsaD [Planctomycetota bacterium]